jgi:hypothetical protein
MSVRVQQAMAMSPDSEPPAASQRVPEPVGPESLDAGPLGAAAQGSHESFAPELLAAVAQPQVGCVSERMPLTLVEVDQKRLGGGLADRDHPPPAALAATDRDPTSPSGSQPRT